VAGATRVSLSRPSTRDLPELLELARASRRLHRPWVYLSQDRQGWRRHLRRDRQGVVVSYLLRRRDTRELVGVVNISEIVRGVFQSAYLGFYAHARHARQGFVSEGLREVVGRAFRVHRLHRVEANIQPANQASLRLVQALGFRREGFSPRYLKIGGRWRDHERWAATREAWQDSARRRQE
jgi:[ribosomal protein S5]-alanine N-acetyltransferase